MPDDPNKNALAGEPQSNFNGIWPKPGAWKNLLGAEGEDFIRKMLAYGPLALGSRSGPGIGPSARVGGPFDSAMGIASREGMNSPAQRALDPFSVRRFPVEEAANTNGRPNLEVIPGGKNNPDWLQAKQGEVALNREMDSQVQNLAPWRNRDPAPPEQSPAPKWLENLLNRIPRRGLRDEFGGPDD